MTFKERAKIATKLLIKQEPVTLEKARAQCIHMRFQRVSKNRKKEVVPLLKMYYPNWTNKQIEEEYKRLLITYLKKV